MGGTSTDCSPVLDTDSPVGGRLVPVSFRRLAGCGQPGHPRLGNATRSPGVDALQAVGV